MSIMERFEVWYKDKIDNKSARDLFDESCMCYKVGAYRAAYIMTYLAFQNVLKDRLLAFNGIPTGMP